MTTDMIERPILTRQIVEEHTRQFVGKPTALIIITVILVSFLLILFVPFLISGKYINALVVGVIGIFLGFFFVRFLLKARAAWTDAYVIEVAACTRKHAPTSYDRNITYYKMWFGKYGSLRLSYPNGWPYNSASVYEQTAVGDLCYVVRPVLLNSPLIVYSAKEWTIDEHTFHKEGDRYIPS